MLLKRLYDDHGKICGVRVLRAGAVQHFSPRIIEQGVAAGWLSMVDGLLTVNGHDGPVVYRIERTPGYYCCHCQAKLSDQTEARAHVTADHGGAASPDASNPAGYRRDNFFACVREG